MAGRPPIPVRKVTEELFNQQKWAMLIRDSEDEPWRPFSNSLSGRPFIYGNLDKALYALKGTQASRWRKGNARLVKAEELPIRES